MTTLTILIVVAFVLGYACIATESLLKVNKAAIALLMFVACWTLYMFDPMQYLTAIHGYTGDLSGMAAAVTSIIQEHLGDTSTTLFFLMGAMTIVEIVDQNGGFNWVRKVMKTKSKRALLWRIAFLTFILSAILDNLTTSIVMIMILRKLVTERNDRLIYASLVIIAANSGGAFSPIGDVTTIMLWNKGLITAVGVISEILVPSLISMVIPAFILQYHLKGELHMPEVKEGADASVGDFTERQRKAVFWIGVGGLMFVPVFKSITHLPPFVGILLVLGVLWTTTELFYRHLHRGHDDEGTQKRVTNLLSRVDMSTILFFLGILMAVSCLSEVGVLTAMGDGLNTVFDGNHYLEHWRQRASRCRLHGYVSGCAYGRHGCRRHLLAAACLLCRRWRFDAHHRFGCGRCGDGLGEDHLRMVHEAHHMDCVRGLYRRYCKLLLHPHIRILNAPVFIESIYK